VSPGWGWVDPVKEAKGKEIELNNLMETLTDIHTGKGGDIDEVIDTRARELLKLKKAEEKYGIKFPKKSSGAGGGSPDGEGEEDTDEGDIKDGKKSFLQVV